VLAVAIVKSAEAMARSGSHSSEVRCLFAIMRDEVSDYMVGVMHVVLYLIIRLILLPSRRDGRAVGQAVPMSIGCLGAVLRWYFRSRIPCCLLTR